MTIREIEGLAELGMWQDAWDALDELEPAERASLEAVRMRMTFSVHVGAWDIGEAAATLLAQGGDEDRQAATRFFVVLAHKNLLERDRDLAARFIKKAVQTWPGIREAILYDDALSELFE